MINILIAVLPDIIVTVVLAACYVLPITHLAKRKKLKVICSYGSRFY